MPSFAHPFWLLGLLTVPPLLWWWRRQGHATLRFPGASGLALLPRGRSKWARRGGLALRGAGLALLIVALAGPRWPDPGSRVPSESLAIGMVLDASSSMEANRDFLWHNQLLTRLEGVKRVFRLFVAGGEGPNGEKLEARPHDLISLTVFAKRPATACPLTLDHAALLKTLELQQARTIPGEAETNPGDAMAWALASLSKAPTRRKVLILLTDGESNVKPPALTPRQAAQLAGNLGIPIYAIDAGPEPVDDPGAVKANVNSSAQVNPQDSLQEVARISQGQYFRASNGKALLAACADIDRLERDRVYGFEFRRWREGFAWFALLSALAWCAVMALENTLWRRVF